MKPGALRRSVAVTAGAWAGVLLGIGVVAAPSAFAMLASNDAGRVVGRMLAQEAYLSLALAVMLLMVERHRHRTTVTTDPGPAITPPVLLLLAILFCTVAGHFAVLPLMDAARAGQGAVSFAVLHGVSAALFVLKGALVLALAWSLSRG